MSNRVTVFSNGIADFVRNYPVDGKTSVSIPVKKNHIADVLASLNVYGDVKLDEPPSFCPENDNAGDLTISVDNIFEDLSKKLSGSKVVVELLPVDAQGFDPQPFAKGPIIGVLAGLHSEENAYAGDHVIEKFLIVLTEKGLTRIPFSVISNLLFTDESVQSEINKALQRNFQKVKKNSTFVNLSFDGENATAIVQYAIPAAAWKISYRISETENGIEFKGLAIVDNNTDEDWKDVIISVVTGEPITFSTDLAESKIPKRGHINVVKDRSIGCVEVESGLNIPSMIKVSSSYGNSLESACLDTKSFAPVGNSRAKSGRTMSGGFPTNDSNSMMQMCSGGGNLEALSSSIESNAEVKEVGDFSIFTNNELVTIPGNRSAVIPIFSATLKDVKTILHFDEKNNPQRPYRSLQFKNETEHSLGRGVCTINQGGLYSGSCVLPATKQDEEQLLPFALETGVKVKTDIETNRKIHKIQIAEGVCILQYKNYSKQKIRIVNSKDEKFEVFVDIDNVFSQGTKTAYLDGCFPVNFIYHPIKELSNGHRYSVDLLNNGETTLIVDHEQIESSEYKLTFNNFNWLNSSFIVNNGPLANIEELKKITELNKELVTIDEQIKNLQIKVNQYIDKQARIRENLKVSGADQQSIAWREELNFCENTISSIQEKEIPALVNKKQEINSSINKILMDLAFEGNF